MRRALQALFFTFTITSVPISVSASEADRIINWEDLIPVLPPLENPFDALEPEQREDILYILRTKQDIELGFIDVNSYDYRTSEEMIKRLAAAGLDVTEFEKELKNFDFALTARGREVNDDLNGRVIRMPGYALPLETSVAGVKEFLLVPFVGACIHTPPPPPNQMVFVTLNEAYKLQGLYDPIWITGRMSIEWSVNDLFFVDGQALIATGYSLSGLSVEPYE